jgi:uncharacterized membrane protein YeiH
MRMVKRADEIAKMISGGFVSWFAEHAVHSRTAFFAAFIFTALFRIIALRFNVNLPKSKRLPASPSLIARGKYQ